MFHKRYGKLLDSSGHGWPAVMPHGMKPREAGPWSPFATYTPIAAISDISAAPSFIALNPDNISAWVTHGLLESGGNTVDQIDISTNTVLNTFTVGDSPIMVAVTNDNKSAWVVNYDGAISIIDISSGTVTSISSGLPYPNGIAAAPDNTMWVISSNLGDPVLQIDCSTNTIINTIIVSEDSYTVSIAVGPPQGDTYSVWVSDDANSQIYQIDGSSATLVNTIETPPSVSFLAVSPDNSSLWASCFLGAALQIDIPSATVNNIVYLSYGCATIAVSPDSAYVWVATFFSNCVSQIDVSAGALVNLITVNSPFGVVIDQFNTSFLVTDAMDSIVYRYPIMEVPTFTVNGISLLNYGETVDPLSFTGSAGSSFDLSPYISVSGAADLTYNILSGDGSISGSILTPTSTSLQLEVLSSQTELQSSGAILVNIEITTYSTLTIDVSDNPNGIALSPDGSTIWVTNFGSNTVSKIDRYSNTLVRTFVGFAGPTSVAVTSDSRFAWVTNYDNASLSIIDSVTNAVLTIDVSANPWGIAISNYDSSVWITHLTLGLVSRIDTVTNTVVAQISVGDRPRNIIISADGLTAWVANENSNTVSKINTETNTVITTINSVPSAYDITYDRYGDAIFVTNLFNQTVTVIDSSSDTIITTISVGSIPTSIINIEDTIYVANFGSSTIMSINPSNYIVQTTITLDRTPKVIDGDRDSLWATNYSNNSVTRIIFAKDSPRFSLPGGSADLTVYESYDLQTFIAVSGGATLTFGGLDYTAYADLCGSILTCKGATGSNLITLYAYSSETVSQSASSSPFTFSVYGIPVFDVSGTSVANNGSASVSATINAGQTIDLDTIVSVTGSAPLSYTKLSGDASLSGSILSVPTSGIIVIQVDSAKITYPAYNAGQITLTLNVTVIQPPPPPPPPPPSPPTPTPSIGAIRSNNVQPTGSTVTSIRGGVELVKQAGQKQQQFKSHADYLRYLKAIAYTQNKGSR